MGKRLTYEYMQAFAKRLCCRHSWVWSAWASTSYEPGYDRSILWCPKCDEIQTIERW